MNNEEVKKALDSLSKTICKEGMEAVTKLVTAMGYVEPFTIEDGVYLGIHPTPGGRPANRIIAVKNGRIWSSEEHDRKITGATLEAFKGGKTYLKLHLRVGDSVTINGQTFTG